MDNLPKRVAQLSRNELNPDGVGLLVIRTFVSVNEASRITGIAQPSISACCNGRIPSAGGYKWCFV